MEKDRYVLRKLIPSKGVEPLTVKFGIERYRPIPECFEEIERLSENAFVDEDPYKNKDDCDGALYYSCKKYDRAANDVVLVYIAVPNEIRVKKSRREHEREYEYER